jgi:hypothetical protein
VSGRRSLTRQEPLGPDETFSALVTRLIITNRAERAGRDKISPTVQSPMPEAADDRCAEPRSGTGG